MKKGRNTFYAILFIICVLVSYCFAHVRVDTYRADIKHKLHAASSPVPMEMVNALAGEFKGLVADYLLLEAANFIGSRQSFSAAPEDWDAVARLLLKSNRLDPYFRSTYNLTQGVLPWQAHKYDETLEILELSRKHLPWDYLPGFYMGFDYHFFLKDNLKASQKLMEASRVPGAPVVLATMASRLAQKSGQTRAAIDFLAAVLKNTKEEDAREALMRRILALQGVEILNNAIGRFQHDFGRSPNTLDELVATGILSSIPPNPYNRHFQLRNGEADF